jgi:uncharacterized protein YndB with AHSA1/START domain
MRVTHDVTVNAPARAVYEMFVDPQKLARWIGIRAMLEPRPGGQFRFELLPGEFCSGHYVELDPPNRVVFTWGWESGAIPVEPGSTTVEVDLEEQGGVTRVRLVHSGLDQVTGPLHADGWANFLPKLKEAAEG